MFDEEYYDYYEESELEKAYDEFLEKVRQCAKKDLDEKIKWIEEEGNRLYNKDEELSLKENEINKKYEDIEKHKGNLIAEWLAEYGLDLKPAQKVYVVGTDTTAYDCPRCKGKGKIDIETKDGEFLTVNCPCCDPSSRKGKLIKNKYYVKPMYVVDVQVRLGLRLNDDYQKSTKISIRGDLYDSDYSWNYYSVELSQDGKDYATRTYSRKDIYLSEDECKKAVEEKQQKESD